MSQNIIYLANSLEQFSYKCYVERAETISITFLAPVHNRTLAEIDPYGAGLDDHQELLIVPLQIKCLGKAGELGLVYHQPRRSLRSGYFAYYHRPETGNTLAADSLANLDEICVKAERYANLAVKRIKEYAEAEKQPYDFRIHLYVNLLPNEKKEKLIELTNKEIMPLPCGDDYASILEKQRHSNPWL